jgi:hypothetical protein
MTVAGCCACIGVQEVRRRHYQGTARIRPSRDARAVAAGFRSHRSEVSATNRSEGRRSLRRAAIREATVPIATGPLVAVPQTIGSLVASRNWDRLGYSTSVARSRELYENIADLCSVRRLKPRYGRQHVLVVQADAGSNRGLSFASRIPCKAELWSKI